jgi:hypothetical protein
MCNDATRNQSLNILNLRHVYVVRCLPIQLQNFHPPLLRPCTHTLHKIRRNRRRNGRNTRKRNAGRNQRRNISRRNALLVTPVTLHPLSGSFVRFGLVCVHNSLLYCGGRMREVKFATPPSTYDRCPPLFPAWLPSIAVLGV